jgi:hypothetical protein
MRTFGAIALGFLAVSGTAAAPALPEPLPRLACCLQDPPPKPADDPTQKKADQEAKEKKAKDCWDAAEKLEKEGKLAEAQVKLRELRSRYRGTSFYFDKMIEISNKINGIGQKMALAALTKTTLYKRPHQDSWYGYEFAPPDGWKGVPPAAQWFNEYDNSEVDFKGQTIRIARYTAPYLDKLYMAVWKVYAATTIDSLEPRVVSELEQRFEKLKEEGTGKEVAGLKMKHLRKIYSTPGGDRLAIYYYTGERRGLALVGAWLAGGEDTGFIRITTIGPSGVKTMKATNEAKVEEKDFEAALKVFDQAAKTFWIYDAATRQGKTTLLNRSALCSDWSSLKSSKGNYLIEYATSADYAKRCGEELENILMLYRQVLPTQKSLTQCRVKVFDREEDFMYYGQMPGAAAYWSPGQEEIVAYKFEGDKVKFDSAEEFTIADERAPEEVTFKILYHEAFHQYMYYTIGGRGRRVYVPSWLNEGLGDYFFGGEWQKSPKKFTIGINDWRIAKIVTAIKADKHVALDKIFRYEQAQYYSNAGLCYAEGWAINYFFQQSDVAKKKGYHMIPTRMLEALKTGGDWEKATDKAFAGIDIKKMEEEWKDFMLKLPIPKHIEAKMAAEAELEK